MATDEFCFFIISILLAPQIVRTRLSQEQRAACKDESVSESLLTDWLLKRNPTNHWERPVKNGQSPLKLSASLAISSFPAIVSPFFS